MWLLSWKIKFLSITITHKYRFSKYLDRMIGMVSLWRWALWNMWNSLGEPQGALRELRSHLPAQLKVRDQEVAMHLLMGKHHWPREHTGLQNPCHHRQGAMWCTRAHVPLPVEGAGFIYLIMVLDFPRLPVADQLAMLVWSMVLSSPNRHTAILPVWELLLFYRFRPKPDLLIPELYVTPASNTSLMATKFYYEPTLSTSCHSSLWHL